MEQTRRGLKPKPTDPLVLGEAPTGPQVVELWKNTDKRFPESRKRIRAGRAVVNKDASTLPAHDALTLPQRLMAVTMTNSLSSQYGTPELTRHGRPTKSDKSDVIETVLKATLEQLIAPEDIFGKATQDAEWGVAVYPAMADWQYMPVYSEEGYDFDADGRRKGDDGYTQRDGKASRKVYDKAYEDFLADHPYVCVDLIDPTDCAPILVRGTRGRRFTARGLVVRRLFSREELLADGYRSDALKAEKATLVPRGDKANVKGQSGRLWLYTVYLTLWDEAEQCLVPCIITSVAGEDTQRKQADGKYTASVCNLKAEYGITSPMWGYYHGLRTADPDPDMVGLPFADAYADLVLALERLMAASVHHAERSSYNGYWVEPGEEVPPEAYTETVENQVRLKSFDVPESGEAVTAPGRVTPAVPAPLGPAAVAMMSAMMTQLETQRPDPTRPTGAPGSSGHAMSLASGLIEAAHSDIPRGVLECYQDVAGWVLECICAVMATYDVPWVVDANEELPPDEPGDHRAVSQRYVLSERDFGGSHKITASWRQKPDPVNITLTMDRAQRGYASVIDVLEASGETNTQYKVAEILYYQQVMTPGTPENLELAAYVARRRGEVERAEQLELEAQALLAPQGTPTDALAPEALAAAEAARSGVATGVKSSIAAATQGETEAGPINADARVGAQMGISPALPAVNGGGPA